MALAAEAQEVSFDEEVAKKDPATPRKPYAVSEKFKVGELVNHPSFGVGIVAVARSDKIDVTFRSFVKTLLHGRVGRSGQAGLVRSAPLAPRSRRPRMRPADAEAAGRSLLQT